MAFPETLSWSFEGETAEEFLDKLFAKREKRPLVTKTSHPAAEVRVKVIENARKRKVEQDARKGIDFDTETEIRIGYSSR